MPKVSKLSPVKESKLLQEQLDKLDAQRLGIRIRLDAIEGEVEMPALIKRYKGKYFKYKNSYGGDNWWWLYTHCISIESSRLAKINSFQTFPDTRYEFHTGDEHDFSVLQIQITKKEYNAALRNFLKSANNLLCQK